MMLLFCSFNILELLAFKLTLKGNAISSCFTLFICGGPCHLSSFDQCSGDQIFLLGQLVYSVTEKNYIWVCIMTSLMLEIFKSRVWISSPNLHNVPLSKLCFPTVGFECMRLFMLSFWALSSDILTHADESSVLDYDITRRIFFDFLLIRKALKLVSNECVMRVEGSSQVSEEVWFPLHSPESPPRAFAAVTCRVHLYFLPMCHRRFSQATFPHSHYHCLALFMPLKAQSSHDYRVSVFLFYLEETEASLWGKGWPSGGLKKSEPTLLSAVLLFSIITIII